MDVVEVSCNGDCIEDTSTKQSLSPDSPDICDEFGESELLPRVGDQYQVEIPPLTKEFDYSPTDAEVLAGIPHGFLVGLPISIMWINEEVESIIHEPLESVGDSADAANKNDSIISECIKETQIFSEGDDLKPKVEPMDTMSESGINLGESTDLALQQENKININLKHQGKCYHPVPGSSGDTWSDIEEDGFLLGLYIFGKSLVQVKTFVESKKMGDILSFYYGKFYRSDRYRRWSECRKIRSRRCIYGQRIFTGLRQQELLSRLLPHVSEECQKTLLEVSKTFGEGKMLFEQYVFTLKATVGLNALVEAVGIGRGKEDLTGFAMEPLKSNQVVPVRPEIPIGKACSTLTTLEIINFLTGDYRLSKARSSDLFWEAVWPRLLARGWHSEQPNDYSCAAGSKHPLVFLIPGIKKFSRRKLVKGNHYFDSVSDVLSKVASDPGLLELEIGADKGISGVSSKEENEWTNETKLDQEDFPDQQRHCYLKPRTPNRGTDALKFTVVDTSLPSGGTFKVRELRSLPVEMNTSTSRSPSEESESNSSGEPTDESDLADTMCFDRDETDTSKPPKINFDRRVSSNQRASNRGFPTNGSDSSNVPVKILEDQNPNMCNYRQPRMAIKGQSSQRMKPVNKNPLAPVTKRRRRLTACNRTEAARCTISILKDTNLKQEEASCCSGNPDSTENFLSQVETSQEKLSSTSSSSKGSLIIGGEGILSSMCSGVEHPNEEPQPRTLIDLNLPVPPDAETDEPFMMEMTERQHDQTSRESDNPGELNTSIYVVSSEQQSTVNSRRHSTRNRPLTTKALEALACGFLSTKQKRKSKDAFLQDNSMSRPPRRARDRVRVTKNCNTGIMDFKVEERGNDVCNSNGDMISDLQV